MTQNIEAEMWSLLQEQTEYEGMAVRITNLACNRLPVHKKRATDIVKSWDNRGLVTCFSNGTRARLTRKGRSLKDLEATA